VSGFGIVYDSAEAMSDESGSRPKTEPVTHSLVKALRGVDAFSSLDEDALLRVVGVSSNLAWRAGGEVFQADSPAEALYVVLTGQVRIHDPADGGREVAKLGPGDSFGEISLLLLTKHTKNAVAEQDTELMVIPHDSFRELLESNPELAGYFQRLLEERQPVRGDSANSV
jgi:CRP/FNR family transcriptional regulator, cyclic AMP receptor protein